MFLLNSLRKKIRSAYSPAQVRRHSLPGRRPQNRRLAIEILEDRTLPSTFTVMSLADSGAGSLRQAVLDADAHAGTNVIRFAHRVHGTITLTSRELAIHQNLDLQRPGPHQQT